MSTANRVRIIIAEDDFLVGKGISNAVKNLGYEIVAEVSSGEQAIEKTCELHPDVVLMDIQMPGIGGIQASEKIQGLCPTPVVILTAYETHDLIEKASKAGAGGYLIKPPKANEIERAIAISIARHADLMTSRKLNEELEKKTKQLEEALEKVKLLNGILPICSCCKSIRDDKGYWNQVEKYIKEHSEAEFTHGLCPECSDKLYGDEDWYQEMKE